MPQRMHRSPRETAADETSGVDADESTETEGDEAPESTAPETVLELLTDEYARAILDALADQRRSATDLVEACDVSVPTVYRRLNRLEAAGLVEAETVLHPEGHHRQEYELGYVRVDLVLEDGELTATVEADGGDDARAGGARPLQ